MQRLPGRHHRQNGNLLIRNHLEQRWALCIQQPFQTFIDILGRHCATGLDTHCITEFNEVWIALVRVCEAVFVEEGLPLCHHALFFVVEYDYFDADVELCGCAELGEGHVEGCVAVCGRISFSLVWGCLEVVGRLTDVYDDCVGAGYFCADGL